MRDCAAETLEDVQGRADPRAIAIQRVGVKAVRHPMRISDRGDRVQHSIALCNMYVALPAHLKGTHMSRFLEILNRYPDPLGVRTIAGFLEEVRQRLEAEAARVELRFPYFVNKRAPVSGVESLLDYEVEILADLDASGLQLELGVMVPVTSLCPCSKSISDYGAHNQRSHVWVRAQLAQTVWIEDLIDLVEAVASCQLYGLLKRPDEKFVTEYAYDHPKFVEDMVRDVALRLHRDPRIRRFTVSSENFESIHNHSAYAEIHMDN